MMFGWLRRMLGATIERRARPRTVAAPPLPLTLAELRRTEAEHKARIQKADALLADFEKFDGALRLVVRRR